MISTRYKTSPGLNVVVFPSLVRMYQLPSSVMTNCGEGQKCHGFSPTCCVTTRPVSEKSSEAEKARTYCLCEARVASLAWGAKGRRVGQRGVAAGRREVLGLEFTAFMLVDVCDAVGAYPELAVADRALGRWG